jgi:hypothetical protein
VQIEFKRLDEADFGDDEVTEIADEHGDDEGEGEE